MQLDLATVLAQWATGGLFFCWVTTRRREVGIGYGWLLRISFGVMAVLSVIAGASDAGTGAAIRNGFTALMALAAGVALLQSYVRRAAGVRGQREVRAKRAARVASMTGDAHGARPRSRCGARVRSASRPDRTDRRGDRACSAPHRSSAATTPSASSASRSARSSSARCPTRCCSVTGTSCSPDSDASRSGSW